MFRKRHHTPDRQGGTDTRTVKGAGLARGPALVLGTILAVFGLILFLHAGDTPTGGFPDADARGAKFLGFESNGWTAFITTAAGVVLLFGAAQHLLAKTASLLVGLALAAAAILDLVNGPGVLGLAAANWAVDLGWGIAAVLLLLNVFAPRIQHEAPVADHARAGRHDHDRVPAAHHAPGHVPPTRPEHGRSAAEHRPLDDDRHPSSAAPAGVADPSRPAPPRADEDDPRESTLPPVADHDAATRVDHHAVDGDEPHRIGHEPTAGDRRATEGPTDR